MMTSDTTATIRTVINAQTTCNDPWCRCSNHATERVVIYPQRPESIVPRHRYPNRAARRAAGYVRGCSRPGDTIVLKEID